MLIDESPLGLATLYADIGQHLAADTQLDAFAALTRTALHVVPGVEWASVTKGVAGRFRTLAATDPCAEKADSLQYELGSGPCVDAITHEAPFRTGDLATDARWPEFGRRAVDATGAYSMLAFRLFLEDQDDTVAGSTSTRPPATPSATPPW